MFPDNGFIEGKPVKAVVLKIVIVNLYKEYSYFEIKRVKRIILFLGNDLATVPIAMVCVTLPIDNSLCTKII